MNLLKMMLVLAICGGQVYLVTQFFNKGNNKRPNINPFAANNI